MTQADMPLDVKLMTVVTNTLVMVFVVLCLAALGHWVLRLPFWTVKAIAVQGEVDHQNAVGLRAQLATSMKTHLAGGLLALDLQPVKQMFEAVPWVRQVKVQREFPNRLRVTLEEHHAVAWWGEASSGYLVNRMGEVFEASPDEGDGLPELVGPPEQSGRVWSLYQRLATELGRLDLGIDRLELSDRGSWRAKLDSGAQVELGRGEPDEIFERLHRLTATISQLTERYPGAVESVDLRYPNGYALRMRGVTTVVEDDGKPTSKTR
ncbi:cell division protein FtsQ [Hydrogenophaga crassostreae]|uniref:Cell division protein FtsQ n=1 Tax=Hydrogenophaga crassostreae TaxID=1763535 RepID=A0A167HN10_9BURK|nr:cell division protein FtsQ/DivIB [Hydrogenophaga crassostreae]AOW14910.1 cell division protein FtsQ [Hydrogenophaga crassostreae]OAD41477.1 cell division protein FtsQ [Hydrogenophaga crassostreae]